MGLLDSLGKLIDNNPLAAAGTAAVAGAAVGAGATALVLGAKKKSSTRRKRKKITHTKRGLKQDRARRSKQKWEVAYRKRKKSKSHRTSGSGGRKVHYARKTGQPYIIKANGQAKFIKGRRRK